MLFQFLTPSLEEIEGLNVLCERLVRLRSIQLPRVTLTEFPFGILISIYSIELVP